MARLENLELPADSSFPSDQAQLLNSRFLLIAERLKTAASSSGAVLQATHVERKAQTQFAAENLGAGTQFWESDRTSVYLVRTVKKAKVWQFEAGLYAAAFALRPTDLALYDTGFLFYATDWGVTWRWTGSGWAYQWGTYKRTQSQLTALAATLGAGDAGLLVWVTDYAHMRQWTGSGWQRGPGDPEDSNTFYFRGSAPDSMTGWHACDGTAAVNYLKYDGSLGTRNLPNVTGGGPCYVKLASTYSETITAAVAPTFTGAPGTTGPTSAGTPAGTISTPTFSGNPLAGHSHKAPIGSDGAGHVWQLNVNGSGTASPGTDKWNSTGDSTSVSAQLTSSDTAGTPSGTISTPTFTGSALATHTHSFTPAGTLSLAGGDPIASFQAIPYFRQ